ncbi:hypothetical protein ACVXG7_22110 [Enterobacter hormaechei]
MTMAELDDAARHVLNVNMTSDCLTILTASGRGSDPADTRCRKPYLHRKEAREVARESMVLLKTVFEALPLKKSGTVAVVGPLADSKRDVIGQLVRRRRGDQSVTVLTGIKSAVGDNAKVV